MNWIEKTISVVSPEWGLRRLQNRHAFEIQKRAYDGAQFGRRTKNWRAGATSQNTEAVFSLQTLRNRSRDLERNNPYAKRALEVLTTNIIGCGFTPAPAGKKNRTSAAIKAYNEWAGSLLCDANNQLNMAGLQSLMVHSMLRDGECIARRIKRNNGPGKIPVAIQVLEADYIDTNKIGPTNGGFIVQGVEFDKQGRRVAYWLYKEHPGEIMRFLQLVPERVPAEEIIHLYRVDRAGQVRGIPTGVSAFIRMRDLDGYADAQLMRQKIAACFTVFIQDTVNPTGTAAEYASKTLEPGAMEVLPVGRSMTFTQPPTVEGYDEYTRAVIREIAMAYGVTYESLTGDLSRVNFSSARMGFIEFGRLIEHIQELTLMPQAFNVIWDWAMQGAQIAGLISQPVTAGWTPPKRIAVDPVKEFNAIKLALRLGLLSRKEAIRQMGFDPDEVTREIVEDNNALDKDKLLLDGDPRADAARVNADGVVKLTDPAATATNAPPPKKK